ACAIALAFAAAPTPAAQEQEDRREIVSYHDLDLAHKSGVEALGNRVRGAIRRVCGPAGTALWERARQRQCVKQAESDARRQLAEAVRKARAMPILARERPK